MTNDKDASTAAQTGPIDQPPLRMTSKSEPRKQEAPDKALVYPNPSMNRRNPTLNQSSIPSPPRGGIDTNKSQKSEIIALLIMALPWRS